MAIKLIVPGPDGDTHQDFILSDFPVNFMADVEDAFFFYRAESADRPLAFFLRNLDNFALTLLASQFRKPSDVFDLDYFSQTPYKLGPGACKFMAKPHAENPTLPLPPEQADNPDFLRERMAERLNHSASGGEAQRIRFRFFVQPQRHPIRNPIEDASFEWRTDEAVPIEVGILTLTPEVGLPILSASSRWHAELLSFNPEHADPDLRPLGGLNRVRRAVYEEFAKMRFTANHVSELKGRDALEPPPKHAVTPDPNRTDH
jgi:hypothetical protein